MATKGFANGIKLEPKRLSQTTIMGDPQQPIKKQAAKAQNPVNVIPPMIYFREVLHLLIKYCLKAINKNARQIP